MVKMNFSDSVLKKIFRRWKWARNNTLELLDKAIEENILDFALQTDKKVPYTFQTILFQFQCLVTTTDTYCRKLTGHSNKSYGILVIDGKVIKKEDITLELIKSQLEEQMTNLEDILKHLVYKDLDKQIRTIMTISDHEYLHQGELILMLRQAGVDLPQRFKKAWAL